MSTPTLPPISMLASRTPSSQQQQLPMLTTSIMPASPPNMKALPILPKPQSEYYSEIYKSSSMSSSPSSSYTTSNAPTTPDQNTLWTLFTQFQQHHQQQQQKSEAYQRHHHQHQNHHHQETSRRASDPISRASTTDTNTNTNTNITTAASELSPATDRILTSEEVLAEKRRRNAGASARFRDRRKQRERELQDKCNELEHRSKELETALRRIDPDHPLLLTKQLAPTAYTVMTSSSSPPSSSDNLFDRVGQLEHMMTRFRQEKETDVQKLDELEKENKYLRSLLVPVSLSRRDSFTDSDASTASNRRKHSSVGEQGNKRIRLSPSRSPHSDDNLDN